MKVNGKVERNEREKGNGTTRKRDGGRRVRMENEDERKAKERREMNRNIYVIPPPPPSLTVANCKLLIVKFPRKVACVARGVVSKEGA